MDTTEYMSGELRPRWHFAHMQDDLNLLILCMFKCIFSLDVARKTERKKGKYKFTWRLFERVNDATIILADLFENVVDFCFVFLQGLR